MPPKPLSDENVVIRTGRQGDIRFIGRLNGRYTLSGRRATHISQVQVFACRVQSISTKTAVITAPVCGNEGDWVTAHFEELGLVRAQITRHVEAGFAMDIAATDEERAKLAARIGWVKKRANTALSDKREHKRLIPRNPMSSLILGDGTRMECFIIDMSRSGVAVSADIYPEIGVPLAVGRVIGRVVRHLDVGFAVQFAELQDLAGIETALAEALVSPGTRG